MGGEMKDRGECVHLSLMLHLTLDLINLEVHEWIGIGSCVGLIDNVQDFLPSLDVVREDLIYDLEYF
jgi:hypothetical protein